MKSIGSKEKYFGVVATPNREKPKEEEDNRDVYYSIESTSARDRSRLALH